MTMLNTGKKNHADIPDKVKNLELAPGQVQTYSGADYGLVHKLQFLL